MTWAPDRGQYPELDGYTRDELYEDCSGGGGLYLATRGDFKKQHTPHWWRELLENSGLLELEYCEELDDAAVLYEEMVRHEYDHNLDPFDVEICLAQMEWERTNRPRRSLFVITAHKR